MASLLEQIQQELIEGTELGPTLLKLRLLAAKVESEELADWVRYETEGYPEGVELPEYRKLFISHVASFSGPLGAHIKNAPIPPVVIEAATTDRQNFAELRQSVAALGSLTKDRNSTIYLNKSNLIFALQDYYTGYSCVEVRGILSVSGIKEVQQTVRSRILELTIALESSVPQIKRVEANTNRKDLKMDQDDIKRVSTQIIHGNYTEIRNNGHGNSISVQNQIGNSEQALSKLLDGGVPKADAVEFCEILSSETPDLDETFGRRAKSWLTEKIPDVIGGAWGMGLSVATALLTQVALNYYGKA